MPVFMAGTEQCDCRLQFAFLAHPNADRLLSEICRMSSCPSIRSSIDPLKIVNRFFAAITQLRGSRRLFIIINFLWGGGKPQNRTIAV